MKVNINRNDKEIWTLQKLENIQKNATSLGVTEEDILVMRERILQGEQIPVITKHDFGYKENYQLLVDDETAGNITTTLIRNKTWEIDIFVYEGFEGRGVAYQSLAQLIQQYSDRKWTANVLENNPNFTRIENILLKLGFKTDGIKIPNDEGVPVQEYHL